MLKAYRWLGFSLVIIPRLSQKGGGGDIKTPSFVCHKNFNLAHIFWSINDRALIFGMHDPCD